MYKFFILLVLDLNGDKTNLYRFLNIQLGNVLPFTRWISNKRGEFRLPITAFG